MKQLEWKEQVYVFKAEKLSAHVGTLRYTKIYRRYERLYVQRKDLPENMT